MRPCLCVWRRASVGGRGWFGSRAAGNQADYPARQVGDGFVEEHIGYGDGDKGEEGGANQPADDDGGQLCADKSAGVAEGQWEKGQYGGEGGHQDGTQAGASGLNEGVQRTAALLPQLGYKGKEDDGVGDHDADEEQEPHH